MAHISRLSVDEVLAIRKRLSETFLASEDAFGGHEPLFPGKLESAVARQSTGFGKVEKYKTVSEVAATLFYGLAMSHAFENGNKRTALVTMLALLERNKQLLVDTSEDDLFNLVTTMVKHELPIPKDSKSKADDLEVDYVARWIRDRLRELTLGDRHMRFRDFRSQLEALGCTFEDPHHNFVKIRRGEHSFSTGYPRPNFVVDVHIVKDARRALRLDEIHGVDSASFYDLESSVDGFVNSYRNLLRRLAHA